jgi:hypothetical protein
MSVTTTSRLIRFFVECGIPEPERECRRVLEKMEKVEKVS